MGDELYNPVMDARWGDAAILISVICGVVGSIGLLRSRRFADAAFIWVMYLAPPIIVFAAIGPLAEWLHQWVIPENSEPNVIAFSVALMFSPLMFLWIGWLFVGGFVVLNGEIDVARIIKSHLTPDSLKYKAIGLAMMLLAVAIYVATMLLTDPSLIRILPFIAAFLLYFRGAFPFVFPKFNPIDGE